MQSVEVVAGDISDPHFMISAAAGCTDVMHLAALIAIPFSYVAPDSYVETNVRGTVNVLQAARQAGVRRFVQTSTSEVYGTAQTVPIKESHPLVGQSPYSASKIASDQMALSFHASFDMPVVVIRPFNTYGPRQSARAVIPDHHQPDRIGQAQDPPRRGQPDARLLVRHRHRARPDRGPDGAGGAEPSARPSISAAASRFPSATPRSMIAEVMQAELEIETDEARLRPANSEVERLWADNSKARQQLGWSPEFGGLRRHAPRARKDGAMVHGPGQSRALQG